MKLDIFDVVKLKNKNNATIIDIEKDQYKAFITDSKGKELGTEYITNEQIEKILIKK